MEGSARTHYPTELAGEVQTDPFEWFSQAAAVPTILSYAQIGIKCVLHTAGTSQRTDPL